MSRKSNSKHDKTYTKSTLPTKVCAVCGLSFSWRKKWQDCWQEVRYCSERCRRRRNPSPTSDSEPSAD